jgi:hypothetical protein
MSFTPTNNHIKLFEELSLKTKVTLKLLAKNMQFQDFNSFLLNNQEQSDVVQQKALLLTELTYYLLDDDLNLNLTKHNLKPSFDYALN